MKIKSILWGAKQNTDYDIILDCYSGTKINSIKTSSVPLAQYWKETKQRIKDIEKSIGCKLNDVEIFFEYPTKSYGRNKASMSDVMVITPDVKIAVEGKYTEYDYAEYETVKKWLEVGKDSENRKKVLEHWYKIIKTFADCSIEGINEIPYQFLHRTASACFENNGKAVVLYQIFHDKDSKNIDLFIKSLSKWIKIIKPKENLIFRIEKIEIKEKIEVKDIDHSFDKEKDLAGKIFSVMKEKDIYCFGCREWISPQ